MSLFRFSRRPLAADWRWLPSLERRLRRQFPSLGPVSVALVSRRVSQQLNARYRRLDRPTDVLSFKLTPEKRTDFIGELVICWPILKEQAKSHGQTLTDELQLLLVHGTLHLLGYDHQRPAQARRMRRLERRLLPAARVV